MQISTDRKVGRRCVLGRLVFGFGWGMAGCGPGPARVSLGSGQVKAVVFVAAMLAGMVLFEQMERALARRGANASTAA